MYRQLLGNLLTYKCSSSQRGNVRYSLLQAGVQFCDGRIWRLVNPHGQKSAMDTSCDGVRLNGHSRGDGLYTLALASSDTQYKAFCDMTTEGGGWTLFATKASYNFDYISPAFNPLAARAQDFDAAGCIPTDNYTQVLFRFRDDDGSRIVYTRGVGKMDGNKENFENLLRCDTASSDRVASVDGFYRTTPQINKGKRDPSINFKTLARLHMYTKNGISDDHGQSNQWLDLWTVPGGSKFFSADDAKAKGTKCVAGTCRLQEPVYLMYR
ncbi:uncharacterized protein LOC135823357 [Sycon ciliatum]|uniref:uncharacterized protein LOC135823357 n=1 Tax=Sycon ciliatum TaxID=27933 RepID=UPI0031F6086C